VPTNPQPQPDAEGKLLWWANDGEHPDARIWLTQDECRALLASLATLRGERDALLAIVNADRTAVCSECLSEALSEEGRVQLYQQLLRDGLSDAEARGTSWPAEPCNHNRLLRTAIDAARAPQGRTE
jgi:hypothetical protein